MSGTLPQAKHAYSKPRQRWEKHMRREDEDDPAPVAFEDVWPDDKPFPLSDAECARLVRGHPVRWRSTLDEMLKLPGMYEMAEGWIYGQVGKGTAS